MAWIHQSWLECKVVEFRLLMQVAGVSVLLLCTDPSRCEDKLSIRTYYINYLIYLCVYDTHDHL